MPTQECLRELFNYDQSTGLLTWREPRWLKKKEAFTRPDRTNGYLPICIGKFRTYVHRVAWVIAHGRIPKGMLIDHIDHDRTNNRLSNLRLVTRTNSNRNLTRRSTNKSGFNGVYWYARKRRWIASIGHEGRTVHLGSFLELHQALAIRAEAEQRLGYHPNHGQ